MILSQNQQQTLEILHKWINYPDSRHKHITLGGYAGTGKTTLIATLRKELNKNTKLRIAFCSYTGKAARDKLHFHLIIIDEASMVDRVIWEDLKSFNIKIIAVGDHGQLPPIGASKFNLIKNPMLKLETIHRQAQNNPIIKLANLVRQHKDVPIENFSPKVRKINKSSWEVNELMQEEFENYKDDTLILCGFNFTKNNINHAIRQTKEYFSHLPEIGDKIICIKNNKDYKVYNGETGVISGINEETDAYFEFNIDFEDKTINARVHKETLIDPEYSTKKYNPNLLYLEYGYAMTVHKAQGSEANKVILIEERNKHMSDEIWYKWLYTGITRAKKELIIIGN
jgi:exodeoxyribonuclease-5